ncbi:class I SAM-dependent methyltransferase [Mycolicibacterium confluentis]|uniref:Uncharacterized protein n=1 Tax=Mycolicibacterium confluentis TaxID=28047 RepID=A0A7I7Y3Q6_9MYCO|nr:class I SAM-dependent methyltransferase [Mycolicibacterium confluentis]MCV7318384.1 class I SAM-dependent methyltransferase [Mycolicibacterium confluentis]ORV29682.1 biotin carboxyl carrier protein [Mycolicibacterium confluentis]BBZ36295.1 hypothetical protein MCNF_49000 [Mycolicibacterium confluentis]
MNRIKAVQRALASRPNAVYLEIGVAQGVAFMRVAADEKIAVDPAFTMSPRTRRLADAKARVTHYFETTSDAFFAEQGALLERTGIDVALIDGLHTSEQALRDVENTLRHLRDDGVIVVHDCNPARASIATPADSYTDFRRRNHWWNVNWSGDVWKAVVHLCSFRPDLQVAVLDCDFGVGLVRRGVPESMLSFTAEQIDALSYEDLAADREHLLNLKPAAHLDEFVAGPPPQRQAG